MTLIALTDCCHRLSVDRKTLHRWLAQAELSLQAHRQDARSKGLTDDQVLQLARAHHRCLEGLPAVPAAPAALVPVPASPELSAELLPLLHTLSTLPEQITALEQHLAQLIALLEAPWRPTVTTVTTQRRAARGRGSTASKAGTKARRAASSQAQRPLPSAQVIPRVQYVREGHYIVLCPKQGLLTLVPDTPQWFAWLAKQSSFRFVGQHGHFSAHHAWRVPRGAWRAHRQIRNHSYSLRLAPTHALTIAVLEQAAEALQAHLR
jgi:hypothetical protein